MCVCVLGLGSQLRPATPGCDVGVCVCFCVRSACTPPLLAGLCGVDVWALARVSAAPRHFRLGRAVWACVLGLGFRLRPATLCWGVGVCVFVCALRLYPATPGWGVRCGLVCLGSGFGCAPPLLAGVCGVGVCPWARVSAAPRHSLPGFWAVCGPVCALCLYAAYPGSGVRCGCVCLGSGFGCAPLSWLGCWGSVCACVRPPLVPRHSWLGCAVGVCVLGLGFRLRPATPGWGVGMCVIVCALLLYPATLGWCVRCGRVCLGSGFGCAPPLLARV